MIRSFRSRDAESLFNRQPARGWPAEIQRATLRKLRMLNRAGTLQDLRVPPGNRLEALKGNREGQHSIRINDQWRICFAWPDKSPGPVNVEIVDYH